ncbi:hypothetical protein O3P69_012609 [Scylla paramamosain]|uniref:Uncharacterized protein n=1 Tax=Scylla paramamosain TaxID=85552 RepID=A0AAW0SET0_SCYPA
MIKSPTPTLVMTAKSFQISINGEKVLNNNITKFSEALEALYYYFSGSVQQSALVLCEVKTCVCCYSHPAGVVTVTCPDLPVTCPDLPVTCL